MSKFVLVSYTFTNVADLEALPHHLFHESHITIRNKATGEEKSVRTTG